MFELRNGFFFFRMFRTRLNFRLRVVPHFSSRERVWKSIHARKDPPPCSSPYWLPNTETIVLSTNQNYRLNMSLVTAYRHDRQFALNTGLESSLRVWKQLKHEPKLQEKVYSSLCWVIFLTWRNRIWWELFLIRMQTSLTCTCMHALHHNREAG